MKINFDTAVFGERDKAHSILSSSLPEFARALIAVTDLPLDLPNEAGNSPMFSGFSHAGKYVFLSSLRDPSATRGGMARTVALIVSLDTVSQIECLDTVFQHLDHNLPQFVGAEPVEIDTKVKLASITSPGTVNLIRALIASKNVQPVVWIGEDGFRDSVCALWRGLPKTLKRTFSFRYSCTPRDGRIKGTDLILTPFQFRTRWKDQIAIHPPFSIPETQAERYFSDEPIREAVLQWSEELNAEVTSFDTLSLMTESQELYRRIMSISDLEVTVLLRNLARLTPDPKLGARIKKRVIDELQSRIVSGPMEIIGYLRNVQADEFDGAFNAIRVATQTRYARAIVDNDEHCYELTRQAIHDNSRPWAIGLLEAFKHSLKQKKPLALKFCWFLLSRGSEGSAETWISQAVGAISQFENAMIDSMPVEITKTERQSIASFCKQQNWSTLHAIVISSSMTPREAIAEQLHFMESRTNGFSKLSSCLGQRVFVDAAMHTDLVGSVFNQVVDDCITDIQLLDLFSVNNPAWRRVLRAVIDKTPDKLNQSNVLDDHIVTVWQMQTEGKLNDESFVNSLSRTKYANLLDANIRQIIWETLPEGIREAFASATARAWILRDAGTSLGLTRPEPTLAAEILSNKHREMLLPVTGDSPVVFALRAFSTFPELTSTDFDNWRVRLLTAQRNLSTLSAQLVGSYIARRGWKTCAEGLLSDYVRYARHDLYPALRECADLFGWITKFRYSLSKDPPTIDQWWQELENIFLYLYPHGPADKNLWERADGHVADIRLSATGREQWGRLIADLRNGRELGKASLKTLLKECLRDYPTNEDTRLLIEQCPFQLRLSNDDAFID